jgi:uncharacterized protein YqhQ
MENYSPRYLNFLNFFTEEVNIMAEKNCRLGTVGGQAVIEGVMMKNKNEYALAVRMPEGNIRVTKDECKSIREKFKFLGWPIIRGVVNMIESLILSMKTLTVSADAFGIEEEETKFEKWLEKHFGKSLLDFVMVIAMILGVALGVGLFFFLPLFISSTLFDKAGEETKWYATLVEGGIKIAIFVAYLWAVSLMKDIRRVFEYHGAEHKTIFCYEAGEELTPENVKNFRRFHPRCGTSFLFIVILISIAISFLPIFNWDQPIQRFLIKLAILPVTVGLSYECIRLAGKHENVFTRILSAPGLWMQRITTREPTLEQIECAIHALKCSMPDEFPDYVKPVLSTAEEAPQSEEASAQSEVKSEDGDKPSDGE